MSDLEVLKEIEKIIGKELKPCPDNINIMDWGAKNCYLLNDYQQIIGLNLRNNQLSDISVLKELKKLIQLNLSDNKLNEISALKELKNLTQLDLSNNQISNKTRFGRMILKHIQYLSWTPHQNLIPKNSTLKYHDI